MDTHRIRFEPSGRTIDAQRGQHLLAAAVAAGIYINSSCGGDGVCGRCKVIIRDGKVKTHPTGRITAEEKDKRYVLACLAFAESDLVVEIPPESTIDLDKITDEDARLLRLKGVYSSVEDIEPGVSAREEKLFKHSPLATKLHLRLDPPSLADPASDLERVYRAVKKSHDVKIMQTGLANVKSLGWLLRDSGWELTLLLGKRNGTTEIVLIEPGDTSQRNFGMAVDIGTTTVSGQLIDLNTKEVLGTKAAYNRQAVFGSDVISRIIFASEKDGLERLHHAVVDNINSIIQELVLAKGVNLNDVTAVACAGNTTMMHLLLRIDPAFIRKEPYVPTANFMPTIRAGEAGIKINPRGLLGSVPGVSAYVGGDITAGVLACGLNDAEKLSLLIDIGTNGEIVLGNREWLACCSASAGPAFEGSGVACGMRASKGAIQEVEITGDGRDVKLGVIGNVAPAGLCGSGYIDCIAELFENELMDRNGKITGSPSNPRIREGKDAMEFVLVFREEAGVDHDIVVTEDDIDNIKRSKGAIYAGAATLVKKMGMSFDDIEQVFVAGGMGNYLDMENAMGIGLLPALPAERYRFVGNSSLAGAREILLSYEAMGEAYEIAKKMTTVELSVDRGYMEEYMSSLFFPHTDVGRFPVKAGKGRRKAGPGL